MSNKINEKLGLKPAGKRAMMRGTGKTATAAALTSARCVSCGDPWILENVIHGALQRNCSRCGTRQPLPVSA